MSNSIKLASGKKWPALYVHINDGEITSLEEHTNLAGGTFWIKTMKTDPLEIIKCHDYSTPELIAEVEKNLKPKEIPNPE